MKRIGGFEMEMAVVRVDDKFRVVIPKRLRESVGIPEKTDLHIYAFENLLLLRKVDPKNDGIMEAIGKLESLGVGNK